MFMSSTFPTVSGETKWMRSQVKVCATDRDTHQVIFEEYWESEVWEKPQANIKKANFLVVAETRKAIVCFKDENFETSPVININQL